MSVSHAHAFLHSFTLVLCNPKISLLLAFKNPLISSLAIINNINSAYFHDVCTHDTQIECIFPPPLGMIVASLMD